MVTIPTYCFSALEGMSYCLTSMLIHNIKHYCLFSMSPDAHHEAARYICAVLALNRVSLRFGAVSFVRRVNHQPTKKRPYFASVWLVVNNPVKHRFNLVVGPGIMPESLINTPHETPTIPTRNASRTTSKPTYSSLFINKPNGKRTQYNHDAKNQPFASLASTRDLKIPINKNLYSQAHIYINHFLPFLVVSLKINKSLKYHQIKIILSLKKKKATARSRRMARGKRIKPTV